MRLYKSPPILKYIYPEAIWHGKRDEKKIYLTFDDGPVAGVTDKILEILDELDVKATFFCIGNNISKNPELFRRIMYKGHGVGNHTYSHLNGWKSSVDKYIEDVILCDRVMTREGYSSEFRLFRPPYGRIRKKVIRKLSSGYKIIMWDVLSYDFSPSVDASKCLTASLRCSEEGSIIIFHDSIKSIGKVKLLIYQYVSHFVKNNYHFCKVEELFLPDQ